MLIALWIANGGLLVLVFALLRRLQTLVHLLKSEAALRQAQQALLEQKQKETEHILSELEKTQDHLVRSTRLATIGKMAAQIAHEIRNPLGAIKNAAFFVGRKLPEQEVRAHENVELIQQEVGICVTIIENILSMTKIHPPRKSQLDLGAFVQEAFERLKVSERRTTARRALNVPLMADPEPFAL